MPSLYEVLRESLRATTVPSSLTTVIDGPHLGREAARPSRTSEPLGTLGDPISTASSTRDALRRARVGHDRGAPLRRAGRGERDDGDGLHRVVRAAAADAHLRCGRLHRRARTGGQGPRLPGRRLRRARGVRHPDALPDGRRGDGRLAQPVLDRVGGALGPRDAVCVLTHDPKFDVPAVIGALGDRRRLHRRDGLAARPTPSGSSVCVEEGVDNAELRRARDVADRARHRRPLPGGDRGVDLRRDHRPAHRPHATVPPRPIRARSTEGVLDG